MHYHNITTDDMLNGDGLRTVLWTAGCSHNCKGCQNPVTHDPFGGLKFDKKARYELKKDLEKPWISGITFSGGDPLNQHNVCEINRLCKMMKREYPEKTIWIYSGYTWEEIMMMEHSSVFADMMRYETVCMADVFVDGRYSEKLRDIQLKWRGSSNQRVIDVSKSLITGKIILHCD